MKRTQIIVVAFCFVLLIGLYFFGKTTKPKADNAMPPVAQAPGGHAQPAVEALDIEAYIKEVNGKVSDPAEKNKIENFTKAQSYKELAKEYQKLDKPLAVAYYIVKSANAENNVKGYVGAGDYNSMLLQSAPDEKAQKFLITNAVDCYKKAVDLDTANTDNKIRLAGAYMEQGTQPMQGVLLLLEIVRRDSTNVDAQLMLGRFGLVSGQVDKAIARFEKILYLQPQNSEALYLLAQAYNAQGNKQKAIDALQKCKKVVKDPDAKKKIESEIENLKK